MTLLYPLGTGSAWSDFELLYSLRSAAKHFRGVRNVVVVGARPQFLEHLAPEHPYFDLIECSDSTKDNQDNVRLKLATAISSAKVNEEFILMNDDFFLLRDVDALTLPHYRNGSLAADIEWRELQHWADDSVPNVYLESLRLTERALRVNGLPLYNYELHVPMRVTKWTMRRALTMFDFQTSRGLLMRSLCGNVIHNETVPLADCKIEEPFASVTEIQRRLLDRTFFSFGDNGLSPAMKRFLAESYSPFFNASR